MWQVVVVAMTAGYGAGWVLGRWWERKLTTIAVEAAAEAKAEKRFTTRVLAALEEEARRARATSEQLTVGRAIGLLTRVIIATDHHRKPGPGGSP